MTRLCLILIALAVITRTRVTVLPGWVVPVPVLILAAALLLCAALVAWMAWTVLHAPRGWTPASGTSGTGREPAS